MFHMQHGEGYEKMARIINMFEWKEFIPPNPQVLSYYQKNSHTNNQNLDFGYNLPPFFGGWYPSWPKIAKNFLKVPGEAVKPAMPQDWQIAPEWLCGRESCYTWKVAFFESKMLPESWGWFKSPQKKPGTPPKLNIELENKLREKESLFGNHNFQVSQDWYNT